MASDHYDPGQHFETQEDCLVVGGRSLKDIAAEVGRTPFYCYSSDLMHKRVAELRKVLPEGLHLHYAMKANPMPAVVSLLNSLVDGLDVASGGELSVALAAGGDPEHISFAGPGKSNDELTAAVSAGVTVNVESEGELRRLMEVGGTLGAKPRVAIRVNPDFELKSSGMKMGGGPKQFGIDAEQVPALLRRMASLDLEFRGFHVFCGSQNLRSEAIIEAQTKTLELVERLAADAPSPPSTVNIGGGFGIPYFPGEHPLDLAPLKPHLVQLMQTAQEKLPGATLITELGRFLVGEAGIYVCRVIDRKVSRGQVFLITDGGLHHHLAASGNFGQILRKNYPAVVGNKMRQGPRESASVVGPLCTPLDLLGDRVELACAEEGDLIVLFQSGAYGLTASPINFLSHPPPGEVLV